MRILRPLAALALGLFLAGCGDDNARPDGLPESRVYNGNYGTVYKRPAVTTEDRQQSYWAQDIAEDYAGPHVNDSPAFLVAASLAPGCILPKPSAEAQVVYVEIYSGYDDAPLYFVNRDDVKAVKRYIEANQKRPDLERMLKINAAKQVDVFITEVEKPVYLVLAAYDQTIWSLQMTEGVQLDGISIIGYEPQALAHAPENVRIGYAVYDKSPQRGCMAIPQRPVNDTWKAVEKAEKQRSDKGFRKTIREAGKNHHRFRNWLRKRVGSPDLTINAYRTAHVLIGPMPATPLRYRRLTDAQVGFTANAIPIWGDQGDVTDRVYDLAENKQ